MAEEMVEEIVENEGIFEENDGPLPMTSLQKYMKKTPWWATSVAFHGLIILCLYLIQWGVMKADGEDIPMVTEIARQDEPLEDKKDEKIFKNEELVRDTIEEVTEITEEVEERVFEETVPTDAPVGDPDMLSDVDLGGDGHIGTMGVGGGGMAGLWGLRGNRGGAVNRYGGKGTITAVERGLEWLKRHQGADGGWGPQDFAEQCTGPNTKCALGAGNDKNETLNSRVGLTGLGLLCFLGAGYTHRSGKRFKSTVIKALKFVLKSQKDDGFFTRSGGTTKWSRAGYANAICTLALAETYGMTRDTKLRPPLEKAVKYLLGQQHSGKAWGYSMAGSVNDTSVSAFILMALKDAQISGIKADFEKAYKGLRAHYRDVCSGQHKGIGVYRSGYSEDRNHSMTGIVMLCNQFMGMKKTHPTMKESAEYLSREGLKWYTEGRVPTDEGIYYIYYASLAMFQHGGKAWKQWNKVMKEVLLKHQIKGGCADGSWPTANNKEIPGLKQPFEERVGKVYTTTLAILTLEVYYRYSPLLR